MKELQNPQERGTSTLIVGGHHEHDPLVQINVFFIPICQKRTSSKYHFEVLFGLVFIYSKVLPRGINLL